MVGFTTLNSVATFELITVSSDNNDCNSIILNVSHDMVTVSIYCCSRVPKYIVITEKDS